jgi:hypothetical protein
MAAGHAWQLLCFEHNRIVSAYGAEPYCQYIWLHRAMLQSPFPQLGQPNCWQQL